MHMYICLYIYKYIYRDLVSGCAWHASCNANDQRNRAGVVLNQLSNLRMGKILRFTIGEPLMHLRTLLSFSCGFYFNLSLFSLSLFSLFIFISLHLCLSSLLFHLFFSSSLLFAFVWRVLCCVVLCCAVLCCCVLLFVVVLCVWLCVCACLWREGGGVYASNTSLCVRSKRPPCVHSERPRVYWHHAHMFYTCARGAGIHGGVFSVSHHTPLPSTPPPQRTQHTTHK